MAGVDLEKLLEEIRAEVALKRVRGEYPPGLEQELELQFESLVDQRRTHQEQTLEQLEFLERTAREGLRDIQNLRGDESMSRGQAETRRSWGGRRPSTAENADPQVVRLLSTLTALMSGLVEMQKIHGNADERLVDHLAKSVLEHLAVVDHLAILVVELERRLDRLEHRG